MMGKFKERGITLVALVVTIIILLILAGIAINLALGENGLITRSKLAKEEYEKEALKEEIMLAKVDKEMELSRELNEGEMMDLLDKYGDFITEDDGTVKFRPNGSSYEIPYEEMKDELGVESSSKIVTITFDSNGGSGNMDKMHVTAGESIKLSENIFTKEHAGFGKWNTDKTGSGTSYNNGDTITVEDDMTLYAMWANYGAELRSKYDNIYTSYDSGNPIIEKGYFDGYCAGNYDKLYKLYTLMTHENFLNKVNQPCVNNSNWNIVKEGTNKNNMINPINNKWICLEFYAQGIGSGEFSNLQLEFEDKNKFSISNAITQNYIEPLVLCESGIDNSNSVYENYVWKNFYNVLSGGSSGNVQRPRGIIIFKVKNKSGLNSISFDSSFDWDSNGSGFGAFGLEGEISISPF